MYKLGTIIVYHFGSDVFKWGEGGCPVQARTESNFSTGKQGENVQSSFCFHVKGTYRGLRF